MIVAGGGSMIGDGLSTILAQDQLIDVVETQDDVDDVALLVDDVEPDVLVVACSHEWCVRLIRRIHDSDGPGRETLAVGQPGPLMMEALLAGACGYVEWYAPAEQVIAAVRAAARGTPKLSCAVADELVRGVRVTAPSAVRLSNREIEVLRRATEGQTNSCIARGLSLSEATVKTYWQRIFRKLDVRDRTTAVSSAIAMGALSVRGASEAAPALAAARSPAVRTAVAPGEADRSSGVPRVQHR